MIDQGNLINTPLRYKMTLEVYHEAKMLNTDSETLRERIEGEFFVERFHTDLLITGRFTFNNKHVLRVIRMP